MTTRSLDLIREEVRNYDARITTAEKNTREAAFGLGRVLLELKEAVPYGTFDDEVKALGLGVKKDTRARLMLVATAVADGRLSDLMGIREAFSIPTMVGERRNQLCTNKDE